MTIRIYPEQIEIGGLLHDRTVGPNFWLDESPIRQMINKHRLVE